MYKGEKISGSTAGLTLETDDTLTLTDGTLSVTNPTHSAILTQEEYDALPEEKRNRGLYFVEDEEDDLEQPSGSISADIVTYASDDPAVTNVQTALDMLFTSGSNAKDILASAITAKGVPTSSDATFSQMADHISQISSGSVDPNACVIMLEKSVEDGGVVTGGGTASAGMTVTVEAEPAEGYIFKGWKEEEEAVTNETTLTFPVTVSRTLLADFSAIQYVAGVDWFETTLPSSANWYDITYGDNKFVAIAYDSNKAAYSFDGINWTQTTLPSSAKWYSITYGGNKFVAVASDTNKAAYSSDGINWIQTTLPSSAKWNSITYGDNKFVTFVYGYNKAAYSFDGINWTQTTLPSSASDNWTSITYGDNKFVAVARSSNKAVYSSDGINWTETTLPSSASWRSIAYGDNKFVAVASGTNQAAYSSDGINWTDVTLPSSASWRSVAYGDNKFVTIAYDSNKAAYSSDGINWTQTTLPSILGWYEITYGDNKFVTIAYSSNKAAYSQTS